MVLLAGGKGTRLYPLTAVLPKPLVPLGEKPVLEILLRRLARAGFRRVAMCTGYLAEIIMAVFGDGSSLGLQITYHREEAPMGTAGPLALVPGLSDPFLILNGDLLTTLDFARMLSHHAERGADATIAVFPRDVCIDFGVIQRSPGGDFEDYIEKPRYHYDVSMGINLLPRRALEFLPPGERYDLPSLVLDLHNAGLKVSCYQEKCSWLDIGRMEDYAEAQERFARNPEEFLPA